ncbi:MAG: hypothetical protein ACE5KV_02275 [Thermoplasmata archaeon]
MSEVEYVRETVIDYKNRARRFASWGFRLFVLSLFWLLVLALVAAGYIMARYPSYVLSIIWFIFFGLVALGIVFRAAAFLITRRAVELELRLDFSATKKIERGEN